MNKKLKTLKDFSDKECYCDFVNEGIGDFRDDEEPCTITPTKRRYIPEKELKAEAVKWVKPETITKLAEEFSKSIIINNDKTCAIAMADFGQYLFQKFFNITNAELFNLTEEDLK